MTREDEHRLRTEALNQARMIGNCCDARTLRESAEILYQWLSDGKTAEDA